MFDLRPAAIIEQLDLRAADLQAAGSLATWACESILCQVENTDKVEALKAAVKRLICAELHRERLWSISGHFLYLKISRQGLTNANWV